MEKEYLYEKCYCAYLDILGFKSFVGTGRINVNAKKPSVIVKYLQVIKNFNDNIRQRTKQGWNSAEIKATSFSDSLIISYPVSTNPGNLFYLIMDIIYLSIDLAFLEVFVRGAITKGSLYHDDSMCFGPALVDAYELESKNAIYSPVAYSKP